MIGITLNSLINSGNSGFLGGEERLGRNGGAGPSEKPACFCKDLRPGPSPVAAAVAEGPTGGWNPLDSEAMTVTVTLMLSLPIRNTVCFSVYRGLLKRSLIGCCGIFPTDFAVISLFTFRYFIIKKKKL